MKIHKNKLQIGIIFLVLFSLAFISAIDINSCDVLDQENSVYRLTKNLSEEEVVIPNSTRTCMYIAADNVTLDCQNNYIKKSSYERYQPFLIRNPGYDSTKIINCDLFCTPASNSCRGIDLIRGERHYIANNVIDHTMYPIVMSYVNNSIIYNNTITGIPSGHGEGINLQDSSNNTIEKNTLKDNNGNGMELNQYSYNNTINQNIIKNSSSRGMYIGWRTGYNKITNNNITLNGVRGIQFYYSDENFIYNNLIKENEWDGLSFKVSTDNLIQNNTIVDNAGDGIWLDFWSDDNTFKYNNVSGSGYNGYAFAENLTGNVLQENIFCFNDLFDINNSESTILIDNKCDSINYGTCLPCIEPPFPQDAVQIDSCQVLNQPNKYYVLNKSLIDSDVKNTGSGCFSIYENNVTLNCDNHIISSSTFTLPGIYSSGFNTTIKNCDVDVNDGPGLGVGVRFYGGGNNQIIDSIFNSNVAGIYVQSSSNNSFQGNTLSSNLYGLYLQGGSYNEFFNNNICTNTNDLFCSSSQTDLGGNTCSPNTCGITCNACA
jgi:parallel beta-helix repeat protein